MTRIVATVLMICLLSAGAQATPTDISVRVLSKDAKFIGSSMGGVAVVIKDADSGEILAEGKTQGGTGDTRRIMRQSRPRGFSLSSRGSAEFRVTIDLKKPTRLQVIAEGPLSNPDSANRVSATQWVIPGKHLTGGDGWLLEMPGFSVSAKVSLAAKKDGSAPVVSVLAKVTMMCGCPTEPRGLWDSNAYEVAFVLTDQNGESSTIPMRFTGKTSHFEGSARLDGVGPYEALVYVYDASNGNTGVDIVRIDSQE